MNAMTYTIETQTGEHNVSEEENIMKTVRLTCLLAAFAALAGSLKMFSISVFHDGNTLETDTGSAAGVSKTLNCPVVMSCNKALASSISTIPSCPAVATTDPSNMLQMVDGDWDNPSPEGVEGADNGDVSAKGADSGDVSAEGARGADREDIG
ncbi:uncharacterized protein LOC117336298 [Pecten maximus]|uniref:uncharacterized protein LOC117336298 n=1 Tax=Pecten maximus TaxID=6579 RepID=UPI001458C626|nr:uncharacterized protein LOC117336298 [Pecten maximus]